MPRRHGDERECGCLLEGQPAGNWEDISGRHGDEFCITSVHLRAENAVGRAEVIPPGEALLASPATQAGRDEDLGPDSDAVDPFPHRFDDPGHIGAGDMREWNLVCRDALTNPDVQVIQCAGFDPNQHLVRPGLRRGRIRID